MVATTPTLSSSQSRRKVVHSILDNTLRFPLENTVLSQWLQVERVLGCRLTAVLPEIGNFESEILGLQANDVLALSSIHRQTAEGKDAYFDLQIEATPHLDEAFMLTLVDITETVHTLARLTSPSVDRSPQPHHFKIEELTQHNHNMRLLNQASRTLITTLEKDAVLEQLLQVATELIRVKGCSIWLWDSDVKEQLVCQAVYHPEEESALLGQCLQAGQGVGGTAVVTGQITVVQNTQQDGRFYPEMDTRTGVTTLSIMAVPLQFHDVSLGVLELVNKVNGPFTTEDEAMAETLATFASVAIYNAQLVGSLQESNEELDSFAHTVAHDLQNTLSIVIGFAELLRRDDSRLTEDRRKKMALVLVKNTYKMSNIIKELLLLSSVRKSDVSLEPLNMKQIVEAALLRLAYVVEDYNPEIILQERWPVALGHTAWIEEIWENYISNALKYGGEPPKVECGGEVLADGRIRFWVRDNGPGLTLDEQDKLFDPFVQLHKVRVKGSGLGLSIVQRIAQKLGGEVGIESEPEKGSTFSFILPAASPPRANS